MKRTWLRNWLCFILVFFIHQNVAAQVSYLSPRQEVLTGLGLSRIHDKGNYNLIPLFWDLNFDLKNIGQDRGIHTPGIFDFVWEPQVAYVFTPNSNAEVATNFFLKFGFLPFTSRWQPYFKLGVGTIFLTEHIHGQSTQFNFSESAGLGFYYFLNPKTTLTLEYRFRHLSNAAIKSPNGGVNTNFFLVGISMRF